MKGRKLKLKKHQRGGDWLEDIGNGIKNSHLISNVGSYVLPVLGGLAGSLADPFIGPAGTVIGGLAGQSANDWIKSQGYGTRGKGYLGGTPSPVGYKKGAWNSEQITKFQGGGSHRRMKGGAFDTVFGTVSANRGELHF